MYHPIIILFVIHDLYGLLEVSRSLVSYSAIIIASLKLAILIIVIHSYTAFSDFHSSPVQVKPLPSVPLGQAH